MAEREEDTIDRAIGSALVPDGSVWQLLDHDSFVGRITVIEVRLVLQSLPSSLVCHPFRVPFTSRRDVSLWILLVGLLFWPGRQPFSGYHYREPSGQGRRFNLKTLASRRVWECLDSTAWIG